MAGNFENVNNLNMLKICVVDSSCINNPNSDREQLNLKYQ